MKKKAQIAGALTNKNDRCINAMVALCNPCVRTKWHLQECTRKLCSAALMQFKVFHCCYCYLKSEKIQGKFKRFQSLLFNLLFVHLYSMTNVFIHKGFLKVHFLINILRSFWLRDFAISRHSKGWIQQMIFFFLRG